MDFHVVDEAVVFEGRGLVLLISDGDEAAFSDGCRVQDVRGRVHTVARVSRQEGMTCLYLGQADAAYFERLFRDVLVDATRFTLLEGGR